VNYTGQYEVLFSGLKPGRYVFDFHVGQNFFQHFDCVDIKEGAVAVSVVMDREERLLDLHFIIEGMVRVPCDRCNELMDVPVSGEERLIVKLGEGYFEESDEVLVVPETAGKIDLGPIIYEYIYLLVPARRVHPDDLSGNSTCDPEVIRKLKELSEQHAPDPRWDVLNQLKDLES